MHVIQIIGGRCVRRMKLRFIFLANRVSAFRHDSAVAVAYCMLLQYIDVCLLQE